MVTALLIGIGVGVLIAIVIIIGVLAKRGD